MTTTLPAVTGRRLDTLLSVAFNLVPVAGVAFWGWDAFALILLYWFENVIVGVRTALTMLAAGIMGAEPVKFVAALALTAFFCVHYGMFCLVHGVFVVTMFGGGALSGAAGPIEALAAGAQGILIGAASIVLWQGVLLIMRIARRDLPAINTLMGEPYPRMIVLHLTIIGGGFLILQFGGPAAGLILLALLKTGLDAWMTWRSGRVSGAKS